MRRHVTPREIRRINALTEQGLRADEIASDVGLAKSTVRKVQSGHYDERLRRDRQQPDADQGVDGIVWCPRCRCDVYPPCQMCRLREYQYEHAAPSVPLPDDVHDPETIAHLLLSVAEIGLSVRIVNILQRHDIHTVNDLLHRTIAELLAIPSIGNKSLRHVLRSLGRLGFVRKKTQCPHAA